MGPLSYTFEEYKSGINVRAPFRYFNFWAKSEGFFFFFKILKSAWSQKLNGTKMFQVVSKLKAVKRTLIEWQNFQIYLLNATVEVWFIIPDLQSKLAMNLCIWRK